MRKQFSSGFPILQRNGLAPSDSQTSISNKAEKNKRDYQDIDKEKGSYIYTLYLYIFPEESWVIHRLEKVEQFCQYVHPMGGGQPPGGLRASLDHQTCYNRLDARNTEVLLHAM